MSTDRASEASETWIQWTKLKATRTPTAKAVASSIRQTLLGYLPSLSVGQSASQRGGTQLVQGVPLPLTGNPWSYGRSLSFGQVVLFDGMQRWNNYRTQQANLTASEQNVVTQSYAVALNVKTAYSNILTAREQASAAQRQLESAEQQLKVANTKMQAGSATRADSLTGAIAVPSNPFHRPSHCQPLPARSPSGAAA